MTVATDGRRKQYTGNGVTVGYSYPYKFIADADLVVLIYNTALESTTTLVLNSDYTVSGAGDAGGGTVTFTVAPTSAQEITIYRSDTATQGKDLPNQGAYFLESLEDIVDKHVLLIQELQDDSLRSYKVPETATETPSTTLDYLAACEDAADRAEAAADLTDDKPYTSLMTGDETFEAVAKYHHRSVLDPNGADRNFNPTGTFKAWYEETVFNAGDVYDVIFDSTGLGEPVAPGMRVTFIYNGINWVS